MNILQVNNFFYLRSGASRYFFELSKLLKIHMHKIAYFAMEDKRNYKSKWSKYFVSNVSLKNFELAMLPKLFGRLFYSFETRNKFSTLLDDYPQDMIHIHGTDHYFSASFMIEAKKRSIPIVQTLHDYHLISLNFNMFHDGKICEITKVNKFYKAIFHKCVKESYITSFIEVASKYFQQIMGWEGNYVDYFISPSLFMKKKLIEYGLSVDKIIHLPHFINSKEYKPNYATGSYILYFGRLSPEKGINYLIEAMKLLPNIKLLIVGRGNGDYLNHLKTQSKKLNNIKFIGYKDGYKLRQIIINSKFTVLPSVCFDTAPLSILESLVSGKPVLASNIGGIPEIVNDGFNGLLFEPGNVEDCIGKINKLWNDPKLCKKMGQNAREYVENNFDPNIHYNKLIEIYNKALKKNNYKI